MRFAGLDPTPAGHGGLSSGLNTGTGAGAGTGGGSIGGIWGSILHEASASHDIPRSNLIVLGPARSGKSSILAAIGHQDSAAQIMTPHDSLAGLGLSYAYAAVYDEDGADEDPAAIVSLYELDETKILAPHLLRFAFDPDTLDRSVVVVCIDWSRPWEFLEQIETCLGVVQDALGVLTSAVGEGRMKEMRDALETEFREYREPEAGMPANIYKFNSSTLDANIAAHSVTLPLGQGILTTNLGIPIVIVCTKSDLIPSLERDYGYGEGTFDYIQQSLRVIALKYGASLFYTSTFRPQTIARLRGHILRLLHRNTESRGSFGNPERAEVVDRQDVCVPAGWDNWGLIRVQGSGFSCEAMAGWDVGGAGHANSGNNSTVSGLALGRALYESEIRNELKIQDKRKSSAKVTVTAEEEQQFLERNLELLNSMSGGPGVSSVGSPSNASNANFAATDSFNARLAAAAGTIPSTVGASGSPLSSSDMLDDVSAKLAKLAKMKEQNATSSTARAAAVAAASAKVAPAGGSAPGSPSPAPKGGIAGAAPAAADNEALSNFFASLLNKKTGGAAATAGMGGRSATLNKTSSVAGGSAAMTEEDARPDA
ncbi:hypothetical protein HDU83_004382 [Entophlyctis luteolus]|nr:hypothetical protein HDU83_004382 [Entophlyctis luteolus]